MNTRQRILTLAIAVALAAAPAQAQDDDSPAVKESGGVAGRSGKKVPRSSVSVSVDLEGLAAERAADLADALQALQRERFQCATCPAAEYRAGDCTSCGTPLVKAGESAVVARAKLEGDRSYLSVTVNPHHWIALSEIEAMVVERGGKVRRADFRVPTYARIAVRGGAEKDAARLRGALIDTKLFPSASVSFEESTGLLWVRPKTQESSPVTLAGIDEMLTKMRGELRVDGVEWATYCAVCGKEPARSGHFATCNP